MARTGAGDAGAGGEDRDDGAPWRRPRPKALAWVVALLLLVVVIGPAAVAALFSWTSFTGRAIWRTAPQPAVGVAMALVTLAILSLPLLAGWVVRRRRRPPLTWRIVGVLVLVVGFCVALDAVGVG